MTPQEQRAYIRRWLETGQLLEQIRWRELRVLDRVAALAVSDDLIDAALRVPFPPDRRAWSGLVDLQDLLRRVRST